MHQAMDQSITEEERGSAESDGTAETEVFMDTKANLRLNEAMETPTSGQTWVWGEKPRMSSRQRRRAARWDTSAKDLSLLAEMTRMETELERKDEEILELKTMLREMSIRPSQTLRTPGREPRAAVSTAGTPGPPQQPAGQAPAPPLLRNVGDLKASFNGKGEKLSFFMTMANNFMVDHGHLFRDDAARIRYLSQRMKGLAADWVANLYDTRAPETENLPLFMNHLRERFEDPYLLENNKYQLKRMKQGRNDVGKYSREFRNLATKVPWNDEILIELYKDGLDPDILHGCLMQANPQTLLGWIRLATEVEGITHTVQLNRQRQEMTKRQPRRSPFLNAEERNKRLRLGMCFNCGETGHLANNCIGNQATMGTKGARAEPKNKESTRQTTDTKQPPRRTSKGPAAATGDFGGEATSSSSSGSSDTDGDSEPDCGGLKAAGTAVSTPKNPHFYTTVTITGGDGTLHVHRALIDSGCSRSLLHPKLAKDLKIFYEPLNRPVKLTQMDGSSMTGGVISEITMPISFQMDKINCSMRFLVPKAVQFELVLGIDWLRKYNPQIDWTAGTLSSSEASFSICHEELQQIPLHYRDLQKAFHEREADKLPPHTEFDCKLELTDGASLPKPKIYPMSHQELLALKKFLNKNLARGFIKPSTAPTASPVFFRKRKEPGADPRLIVNYSAINQVISSNCYPIPLIRTVLDHLVQGKYFTKLDLKEAFHRIRMDPDSEWLTTFATPMGNFKWTVLPFGLQSGPSVFQMFLNTIFHDLLYQGVLIYLDDILIYADSMESHVSLVREVLRRLIDNNLVVNLSKCKFDTQTFDYLGYRIQDCSLKMDPSKVNSILQWPVPKTLKQLQQFLGFANFYRNFIEDFAAIALPLTDLLRKPKGSPTRKSHKLSWSPECDSAFELLKSKFTTEPLLLFPDNNKQFIVQTDASDFAMAAVLLQHDAEGALKPCAFISKKFSAQQANWPIWEKEAKAIHFALSSWRHLLEGARLPFEVWTDHRNLQALQSVKKLSPKQARWAEFFQRFRFKIVFKPGRSNQLADPLSRLPCFAGPSATSSSSGTLFPTSSLASQVTTRALAKTRLSASSLCDSALRDAIIHSAHADSWLPANKDKIEWVDNLPFYGAKVYVPPAAREHVLHRHHDSKPAGHFGFLKTLHAIRRLYWWPGLNSTVQDYVKQCAICNVSKSPTSKPQGLLQPLPVPSSPWSVIAWDFIVSLPSSHGFHVIWVITDHFSKQCHFVPLKKVPAAEKLADLFVNHVWKLHGLPSVIISDRDPIFTSKFWTCLLKILGITQKLSSAYHPQTDGQSERANRSLEQFLRCFVSENQNNWASLLPFAEFAVNSAVHVSTGKPPFEIAYGFLPSPFPPLSLPSSAPPSVSAWVSKFTGIWQSVSNAIAAAKASHKRFADRKRQPNPPYKPGDLVFLSAKNISTPSPSKKLSPRFLGPFPVKRAINDVSFELDLPSSLKAIHPVFHSSLLKRAPSMDSSPPDVPQSPD